MLTTYVLGSLALIIKPGPDLMCLLATAISEGRARAFALMVGQMTGCWLWILLLPLGVASFFTAHSAVMTAIQIIGMAYIGYLAFLSLREARAAFRSVTATENDKRLSVSPQPLHAASCFGHFRRGVTMAMSNPLTILFFLAFLPHFTRSESTLPASVQTFLLGTLFCALVPLIDIPVILAADVLRARLIGRSYFAAGLKLVSGVILVAVVVILAVRI